MEWMSIVSEIFSGGAIGAIAGLFGKWLEGRHELALMKFQAEEKQKDRDHDLAVMKFEADSAERLAEIDMVGKEKVADIEAMAESIKAEAKGATWSAVWASKVSGAWGSIIGFMLGLVDVIRGLQRPGITTALTVFAFWFVATAIHRLPETVTDELFIGYIGQVLQMALFLWGVSVGWYFATRPHNRLDLTTKKL